MAHHHVGWAVEAFDQQAGFLVDVEVEWPARAAHAVVAQPAFGVLEQGVEDLGPVRRLDRAEEAGGILVAIEVQLVDLGADPADRLTIGAGQPGAPAGMAKERIALRQCLPPLHVQGRDPVRIVAVEGVRDREKGIQIASITNRDDLDRRVRVRGCNDRRGGGHRGSLP